MQYFIDGDQVTKAQALAVVQRRAQFFVDDADVRAIWSRAHRDDEDGDHARETLGEITDYALEMIAD